MQSEMKRMRCRQEKAGRSCPKQKKSKRGVEKMKLLVSACLLGCACRYDGAAKQNGPLVHWLKAHDCTPVPVCPEIYGGLPTPAPPPSGRAAG